MKKIIIMILIIFITIVVLDFLLSIFLDKEIYKLINNNVEIKKVEKSRKQITGNYILKGNNFDIPYWENNEYRGPFLNYTIDKQKKCRILGIGDSIIWGSGVEGNETYLYNIQQKLKNTEIINLGVPGFDTLQEIVKYNESKLGKDTDLLIWHIWGDDDHIYKLINGVLYDSRIEVGKVTGKPILFTFLGNKINNFLLKNSYLYNKLLKIKLNGEIKKEKIDNDDYIINKLEEVFNDYLNYGDNKKILLILSPDLEKNIYKKEKIDSIYYKKIEKKFNNKKNIKILYLDKFFEGKNVEEIRYDDCCHFNIEGHKIISEKLLNYIKNNKLLNEKCY